MKNRIGIRLEDKNLWEKRVALVPSYVKTLVKKFGFEIKVQPSTIRIFPDQDYASQGAIISDDLNDCEIIIAVKEIPEKLLEPKKTYMFFSHTTKGQQVNMPMLKKLKELKCTLIDFEKIKDAKGKRLVFFGHQAGQAGMIEVFHAMGKKMALMELEKNPFQSVRQPYQYENIKDAKNRILRIGRDIDKNGIDASIAPLIVGFSGYGHTSQGAQEIFDLLPSEEIKPEELSGFVRDRKYSHQKVYKVVFKEENIVEHREKDAVFDLQDYYDHPEKYRSKFEQYLPNLTALMNCIYWQAKYPRLVRNEALKKLFKSHLPPKLQVIGDISCDIQGSIECTQYSTTPDDPVFTYDPVRDHISTGISLRGPAVMSIDNLPAEIPLDSSVHFSYSLEPYIPEIAGTDFSVEFEKCQLPPEIKKAVILYRGEFAPDYKYMENYI